MRQSQHANCGSTRRAGDRVRWRIPGLVTYRTNANRPSLSRRHASGNPWVLVGTAPVLSL